MKTKKSIKRAPITKEKNVCWPGCGESGTGTLVCRWGECTTELLLCPAVRGPSVGKPAVAHTYNEASPALKGRKF